MVWEVLGVVIRTGVGKSGAGYSHPTPLGWAWGLRLTDYLSHFLLGLLFLKLLDQALDFQDLPCHQHS